MTSSHNEKMTPMMQQWHAAKRQHEDAILLFRMGDFYELFGDDASIAAPILDLTLTSRDKDKTGLKMAGFPHHSADNYIAKLVEEGHKVAICEQLEDPRASKGIVKRGITQVITPGTAIDSEELSTHDNAYLLSLCAHKETLAIAAIDFATARFVVTSTAQSASLCDEILRLNPRELVVLASDEPMKALALQIKARMERKSTLRIEIKNAINHQAIKSYMPNATFGFNQAELTALSLCYSYIFELKSEIPAHIGMPVRYSMENKLLIDQATAENLDLLPKKKGCKHNLYSVLNHAKTSMGKRALAQAVAAPSTDSEQITKRQQIVEEFLSNGSLRDQFRNYLGQFYDLEKLTALCASNKITPLGLARLRDCLQLVNTMKALNFSVGAIRTTLDNLPDLSAVLEDLTTSLSESPPLNIKDGGIFQAGFNDELDEYVGLNKNAHDVLLAIEARERTQSGIASLKVKYTRVFGYYIEVTRAQLDKVPAHYQRKQTIANGERFITTELSDLEIKLNSAKENIARIEQNLFDQVRKKVAANAPELMALGKIMAYLDMLAGFAEIACIRNFCKPNILPKARCQLEILAGRHPIIEEITLKTGAYFVPNDFALDHENCSLILLTGPNMAGKSTIMRQVALIQIMAQLGSFVPASSATLSICDAIFARVGASDDLSLGRSTFMVEMSETAHILNNATKSSLILLDEIGRGTSTYDGMALAQAVAEHIHHNLKARTIFATHYHELTKLSETCSRLKNFHVAVEENQENIRFLYALLEGPAQKSFGIQVARLAKLPQSVISRASEVLAALEIPTKPEPLTIERPPQLDLFGLPMKQGLNHEALHKITKLDLNRLTPLQALNKLAVFQSTLRAMITKDQ